MEILAKAIAGQSYRSHVLLVSHHEAPASVSRTDDVEPGSGVLLAEASSPAFATWLIEAINSTLDEEPQADEPPPGELIRHGSFDSSAGDGTVHAHSVGRPAGDDGPLAVARCPDPASADALADRLNALLSAV